MGETCSTHEGDQICIQSLVKNLKKKSHLGDIGVDGIQHCNTKMNLKQTAYEGAD
jgi:hypothetical protein